MTDSAVKLGKTDKSVLAKSWHRSAFSKENETLHIAVCGIFPFLIMQHSLTETHYFSSIFQISPKQSVNLRNPILKISIFLIKFLLFNNFLSPSRIM